MDELTPDEIVLAGLGRGRGRGSENGQSLKNAARYEIGASKKRKHFLERINQLPSGIQKSLKNGKAQISDSPYYSTAEITGTRAELIKTSVSEQRGITNIDNGKLNKDRHFVCSAVRVLYDANAIDGAFTDIYPAPLLNGEWELELNGKKLIPKQPMRKFFDGFLGYAINKPFGTYELDNPKVIEPQQQLEFNVDLPADVPGFLKVFLEGTTVFGY